MGGRVVVPLVCLLLTWLSCCSALSFLCPLLTILGAKRTHPQGGYTQKMQKIQQSIGDGENAGGGDALVMSWSGGQCRGAFRNR